MSTPAERDARNARVDRAVAEDVAVGMAAKADREAARANVAEDVAVGMAARADQEAVRADLLAAQNAQTRAQRDAAVVTGAIAREEARSASFGFWLLLGVVGVALLIGAIWYANRPEQPTAPTVTINRTVTPAQPQPAAPPVVVTTPPPPPAAVVVDRPVIVNKPVAVPVPVPVQRPAAPAATAAPPRDTTIIVEPAEPKAAAPEAETAPAAEGAKGTSSDTQ